MARPAGKHRTSARRNADGALATLEAFAPDRPVWYRQPREPETAYAAFLALRDGPVPRVSLPELHAASDSGHSLDTYRVWSGKWKWSARLEAWDHHLAGPVHAAIVESHVVNARDVAEQTRVHAKRLHELAERELEKMLAISEKSRESIVTPKTLMAIITLALQLDHALLPTDATPDGAKGGLDFDKLSTDDLKSLTAIARKVGQ